MQSELDNYCSYVCCCAGDCDGSGGDADDEQQQQDPREQQDGDLRPADTSPHHPAHCHRIRQVWDTGNSRSCSSNIGDGSDPPIRMDRAFVSSRDTDLQFYDCLLSTIRIWIQRKVSVLLIRIKNFFLDPELFVSDPELPYLFRIQTEAKMKKQINNKMFTSFLL